MKIKPESEKLIAAFDHMIDEVHQAIHEAEEALAPTVDEMVNNAQKMAAELHALTQEESERLAKSLKREIQSANKTLNQQGKELKDWLSFDLDLVEDKFIEMVAQVADKTWLDLRAFETGDEVPEIYHSGEVCNAGTLICTNCSKNMKLTKTSHIPPCSKCHHAEFYRVIA